LVSQLKVNEIIKQSGSSITIGEAGDTASGIFTNTPAFEVYKNSNQSITDNTVTKVTFDVESFDTNSAFDLANDKFTVPSGYAGKYYVYLRLDCDTTVYDMRKAWGYIYLNGSVYANNRHNGHSSTNLDRLGINVFTTIDLSVGDYVEAYVLIDTGSSQPQLSQDDKSTMFGAYKLIGA
jgi:hypothetical protein